MKTLVGKAIISGTFLLLVCAPGASAAEDVLIADFEEGQGTAKNWRHEGMAFASPIRKRRHGRVKVVGCRGQSLLSSLSWEGADNATGRMLSPVFEIERKYVRFLVAGGNYPGRTCVNLLVDARVVRSVSGTNTLKLEPVAFDVTSLGGKAAQLEIVDEEQRPWGHISIDHVVLSDNAGTARIIRTGTDGFRGSVQTRAGRIDGDVQLHDGVLEVDGKPVPLKSLQFVVSPARSPRQPQPHALHMVDGEVWRAQIRTFADGKLSVAGGLFGKEPIDAISVAALDFAPETDLASPPKPGVLYRTQGRPIPGKLVWIKEKDIAIDCPLGILPLPRTGLVRYFFPKRRVKKVQTTADELGLRDGTILRGSFGLEGENVVLERPDLAKITDFARITVPWDDVRYLIRGDCGITWLAELPDLGIDQLGPLGPPAAPQPVDLRRTGGVFLSSLRMSPQTVVRYRLPTAGSPDARMFRTVLMPAEGCRGDITLNIEVSGRPVLERELSATDSPHNLSLPLPEGNELVVRVDFGERLAYPCGVDFRDAHIMIPRRPEGE